MPKAFAKSRDERKRELSLKVGDGKNRKGGILYYRRLDGNNQLPKLILGMKIR